MLCKRPSFSLQKMAFWLVKNGLWACSLPPFVNMMQDYADEYGVNAGMTAIAGTALFSRFFLFLFGIAPNLHYLCTL